MAKTVITLSKVLGTAVSASILNISDWHNLKNMKRQAAFLLKTI